MRMGIMQPYFFPYLGYFSLISSVDEWIVFDVTQYTPKSWMNRNRILHPTSGWQYVTLPLANSSISIKTSEAKILNLSDSKNSVIGKISHYKKKAPYFHQVNYLVNQAFACTLDDSLVNLNVSALSLVCEYIGIPFNFKICSELALDYPPNMEAGDWAPLISGALGASEYVNTIAGKALFESSDFHKLGIDLYFSDFSGFEYNSSPYQYEPNLSILDVMMWNSPEEILERIQQASTISKTN